MGSSQPVIRKEFELNVSKLKLNQIRVNESRSEKEPLFLPLLGNKDKRMGNKGG